MVSHLSTKVVSADSGEADMESAPFIVELPEPSGLLVPKLELGNRQKLGNRHSSPSWGGPLYPKKKV
jgi:hypothetical protein